MNAIAKLVLQHSVSAVVGAGAATAATVAVVGTGAHETLTLAVGDTITPRFSITTDSVLKAPGGGVIVVTACGASHIYLRNYQRQVQRTADTVDVTVPCPPPLVVDTPIATIDVCFLVGAQIDSAAKYGLRGDISPSAEQLSHVRCDSTANLSLAAFRAKEFERQHPRTASIMFAPSATPAADSDPWAASRVSGATIGKQ